VRAVWGTAPATVAAVAVGMLAAGQARVNGAFGEALGDSLYAAGISLLSGVVVLTAAVALTPGPRRVLSSLPAGVRSGAVPGWQLLGGVGGAIFVPGSVALVPRLGTALFLTSLVAGQLLASLVIDRVGLGPAGRRPVTRLRLLGAALTLASVSVAASTGTRPRSGLPVGVLIGAAVAVGVAVALQQTVIGRLTRTIGEPMVATFGSFILGTGIVGVLVVIELAVRDGAAWSLAALPPLPWDQWWLMLGGVMGTVFIAVSAVGVRSLGVLVFGVLTFAGQLGGALVIDATLPFPGQQVTGQLIVGVLGMLAASSLLIVPLLDGRLSRPVSDRGSPTGYADTARRDLAGTPRIRRRRARPYHRR